MATDAQTLSLFAQVVGLVLTYDGQAKQTSEEDYKKIMKKKTFFQRFVF